jgi:hypothetical protein
VDDKTGPFHWREQATRLTIIATRPAKRVPWFLRGDGAGDVPAPSACIACFQQAKWWLSEGAGDLGELGID